MKRAADAPTLTEALRRTAANQPEIVAVRTADVSLVLSCPAARSSRRR
jgi:hypothetical protein